MKKITLIIPGINPKTNQESYHFNFFSESGQLVLVGYFLQEKSERKRKWTNLKNWSVYNNPRNNTCQEPELTPEIAKAALEQFISNLSVATWKQYKNIIK